MKILIAIPAYNEEKIIEASLKQLADFCRANLSDDWQIVVADNKPVDRTGELVKEIAKNNFRIIYYPVAQKGKGLAIRSAWQKFPADIYCFMDADLSTDLSALPELINAIKEGHYDLAVGSRFVKGAIVKRTILRKIFSRGYRLVIRCLLSLKVKDAPCGFKAISQIAKEKLLPQVKNNQWFFDTELLVLAQYQGFKIKEIPVIWREIKPAGRTSQVRIFSLTKNYLREVYQLRKRLK
ncbi:MAG: glycosyltransferase [bacterium]